MDAIETRYVVTLRLNNGTPARVGVDATSTTDARNAVRATLACDGALIGVASVRRADPWTHTDAVSRLRAWTVA